MEFVFDTVTVTSEGPDSDGDCTVTATAEFEVTGPGLVDLVVIRQIVRTGDGLPVLVDSSDHEEEFEDGDDGELDTTAWQQGGSFVGYRADVALEGYSATQYALGTVDLPQVGEVVGSGVEREIGDGLVVLGWSLQTDPPDDDGDCYVRATVVLHNRGRNAVDRVETQVTLRKRNGNELDEGSDYERGVAAGALLPLDATTFIKEKWLRKQVRAELSIKALRLVASAVCPQVPVTPA